MTSDEQENAGKRGSYEDLIVWRKAITLTALLTEHAYLREDAFSDRE